MSMQEIREFVYCEDKKCTDYTLINADRFNRHQKNAIKFKCQKFLYINKRQKESISYNFTIKGRLIAWVKMDPLMISEIHKRVAKNSSNDF